MKRSVLSACAAIVQKEIEFYAGFTCLEYDVNDENTMRVAGTGISGPLSMPMKTG